MGQASHTVLLKPHKKASFDVWRGLQQSVVDIFMVERLENFLKNMAVKEF